MTWTHVTSCHRHHRIGCDCGGIHYDTWLLFDDTRREIGCVQQFEDTAPYYGTCAFGRTGPMGDRLKCQAKVEKTLEVRA